MEKHTLNDGFMLVEMCLILVSLSVLFLLSYTTYTFKNVGIFQFQSAYWLYQAQAIERADTTSYISAYTDPIQFNAKGNIQRARTVFFPQKNIVISLGGGRIVEKKE